MTRADLAKIEATLHLQLNAGAKRMDQMQTELAKNTVVTTEVRDFLAAVRGGFKVLGWLGGLVKWAAPIAAAAATLWHLFSGAPTHPGK